VEILSFRAGLRQVEANRKPDALKELKLRLAIQAGLDDLDQGSFQSLSGRDEIALHLRNLGKRAAEQIGFPGE
jgi:hypothetical protein